MPDFLKGKIICISVEFALKLVPQLFLQKLQIFPQLIVHINGYGRLMHYFCQDIFNSMGGGND